MTHLIDQRLVDKPSLPDEVEEAIGWKVLLDSGEATDETRKGLAAWLRRSRTNADAWARLCSSMSPFDVAGRQPFPPGALAGGVLKRNTSRRTILRGLLGVCTLGGMGAVAADRYVPLGELTADHFTLTGKRKSVALADGSTLILGPRTAVDLDFDAGVRNVSLRDGEIMLKGRPDQRTPFLIKTNAMTLQANGGTFVLRQRAGLTEITAVDASGSVVHPDRQTMSLANGQCIVFDGDRYFKRDAELRTETAWVDGLLVIDNHSVAFVAASLRPYFPGLIRVDNEVSQLRVTGVFPLTNPSEALGMIGETLGLSVQRITPYWLSIGPGSSRPA